MVGVVAPPQSPSRPQISHTSSPLLNYNSPKLRSDHTHPRGYPSAHRTAEARRALILPPAFVCPLLRTVRATRLSLTPLPSTALPRASRAAPPSYSFGQCGRCAGGHGSRIVPVGGIWIPHPARFTASFTLPHIAWPAPPFHCNSEPQTALPPARSALRRRTRVCLGQCNLLW